MKIKREEITEQGIQVEFTKDKSWLSELFREEKEVHFSFAAPTTVSLKISRSGKNVFIHGTLDTSLLLACTKCAEDFVYPLREAITYTLTPWVGTMKRHAETELTSEDLEFSFYDGEDIDLGQIVKEQIFLSVPAYPRCTHSCKGLCPVCGMNLNVDTCRCSQRKEHSTFSAIGR